MKRLIRKSDAVGLSDEFRPPNLPQAILQNGKKDPMNGETILTSESQLNINNRNRYASVGYVSDDLQYIIEGYNYGRKIPISENNEKKRKELLETQDVVFLRYDVKITKDEQGNLQCVFPDTLAPAVCYYAEKGKKIYAEAYAEEAASSFSTSIKKKLQKKEDVEKLL